MKVIQYKTIQFYMFHWNISSNIVKLAAMGNLEISPKYQEL
ncbi:hypothetical protein J2Z76_002929 [Sedimentibacter acidaminivorans]|uniref:Uncharacterized protein n=1 Tax=Sedimentibacter acidaminivorans TaxID=913099 RepID=A0ABS4GHP5_9FIRM|nr:hypothetical protein [Sedimentibacter acidaminivorans]